EDNHAHGGAVLSAGTGGTVGRPFSAYPVRPFQPLSRMRSADQGSVQQPSKQNEPPQGRYSFLPSQDSSGYCRSAIASLLRTLVPSGRPLTIILVFPRAAAPRQ